MKKVFKAITGFFNKNTELGCEKSWAKYLESELSECYAQRHKDASDINKYKEEINKVKKENAALSGRVSALLETADELRNVLHQRAATDAERDFIRVCKDIYRNGKTMSERRFNASLGLIVRQRQSACINRKEVNFNGSSNGLQKVAG